MLYYYYFCVSTAATAAVVTEVVAAVKNSTYIKYIYIYKEDIGKLFQRIYNMLCVCDCEFVCVCVVQDRRSTRNSRVQETIYTGGVCVSGRFGWAGVGALTKG